MRDRGVLLNDMWVRVAFVLIVLSCVMIVTFVLLMEARGSWWGGFISPPSIIKRCGDLGLSVPLMSAGSIVNTPYR